MAGIIASGAVKEGHSTCPISNGQVLSVRIESDQCVRYEYFSQLSFWYSIVCTLAATAFAYCWMVLIQNFNFFQIPDSIQKPDYYEDGIPRDEIRSKQQQIGMLCYGISTQSAYMWSIKHLCAPYLNAGLTVSFCNALQYPSERQRRWQASRRHAV